MADHERAAVPRLTVHRVKARRECVTGEPQLVVEIRAGTRASTLYSAGDAKVSRGSARGSACGCRAKRYVSRLRAMQRRCASSYAVSTSSTLMVMTESGELNRATQPWF